MINVGIIGYGKMGQIRHQAVIESGKGHVVSFSDVNKLDDPKYVENEQIIIKDPSIDAVFICTPNYLNYPLTIQCLQNGKHVFCEKPPAFNSKEVEEVVKIEMASGKKLMYGFNHRHHTSIQYMKTLIDSMAYGKILWLRGRYGKSVDELFFTGWRADKEKAGGGILLDQGIHMLDLFIYLSGGFHEVKAYISNLYWNLEIEDNAFVMLKNNENGIVASLHSTMTQWRHLFSLEVFLEKGYMVLNGLKTSSGSYGEEILSIAKNRTTAPAATWKDEEKITYSSNVSWRSEVDHFFNSIMGDKPIEIGNSTDAFNVMSLIDKIYADGK